MDTIPAVSAPPMMIGDEAKHSEEVLMLPLHPKVSCAHDNEFVGRKCSQCGFWLFDADD
jgi:hypothetical protein